ncbi:hypothetical protein C8J27_10662 [Rhodobacter aestuarii]|uniref:Uncharacterized protein n=1 Tax=Rhodobacter aestuarii TaxID=453582 RepID=A0A1N7M298_9RHOB|nr:hypothetical protein C8J27_10662 [Rhodobacter aestuarii]SIS80172.1 hypothetical protein SAMN05421580_10562 [Rhodobacter aestuarii]
MNALRRLWREQRGALIAFVLAALLAAFFGGRIVVRTLYWANPEHQHQAPEGWMTPGYIARSWHLPVEQVDGVLGIENGPELVGKGPPTLDRIARKINVPLPDLIARLETGLPALVAAKQADPGS